MPDKKDEITQSVNTSPTPILCPACSGEASSHETHCPTCGYPLMTPAPAVETVFLKNRPRSKPISQNIETFFDPTASAILKFMPSNLCLSFTLEKPYILGRVTAATEENILDLTDFNAVQLGVSRRHCQLQRRGTQLLVIDLGSANGTFLNERQLVPNKPYPVTHGDELTLGALRVHVFFNTH